QVGSGQVRGGEELQKFNRRGVDAVAGDNVSRKEGRHDGAGLIRPASWIEDALRPFGQLGEIAATHGVGGNGGYCLYLPALSEPLVVAHEEELVFSAEQFRNGNGSTEGKAELVPLEVILGRPRAGERVVLGVQFVVAQKIKQGSVIV